MTAYQDAIANIDPTMDELRRNAREFVTKTEQVANTILSLLETVKANNVSATISQVAIPKVDFKYPDLPEPPGFELVDPIYTDPPQQRTIRDIDLASIVRPRPPTDPSIPGFPGQFILGPIRDPELGDLVIANPPMRNAIGENPGVPMVGDVRSRDLGAVVPRAAPSTPSLPNQSSAPEIGAIRVRDQGAIAVTGLPGSQAVTPIPTEPNPSDIRSIQNIGTAPVFNETAPDFSEIGRPTITFHEFNAAVPEIETDFPLPDQPEQVDLNAPVLRPITLPTLQQVTIPAFTQALPNPQALQPPNLTFSWQDAAYNDDLLAALKNALLNRIVNGGTGLNPIVEAAIWARGRDREVKNGDAAQMELLNGHAARGWSLPSAVLSAQLQKAKQDYQDKIADLSREVMIQQATLEQRNIEFALQTALGLEQALIQEHSTMRERALRAAQYMQQAAIDVYNAQAAKLNLEIETFKAYALAYETRLRGELSKLELFKGELEAQGLISQLNKDDIQIYQTKAEVLKINADIYNTIVNAINTRLNAEGQKINLFRAQVEAVTAQNQNERVKVELYSAEQNAEELKVKFFNTRVQGALSRLEFYSKQAEIKDLIAKSDIQISDLNLRRYLGRADALLRQEQLVQTKYTNDLQRFSANMQAIIQAYEAQLRNSQFLAQTDLAVEDLRLRRYLGQLDGQIKFASNLLDRFRSETAIFSALTQADLGIFDASLRNQQALTQADLGKEELLLRRNVAVLDGVMRNAATQLEAYRSDLAAYTANLDASVRIFSVRSENERARAQIDISKEDLRLRQYISELELAGKQVDAAIETFKAKVQGFAAETNLYTVDVDAAKAVSQNDIAIVTTELQIYLGQLDAVIKKVAAKTELVKTAADIYRSQTNIYTAQVGAEASKWEAIQKQIENNIQYVKAQSDVAVANAQINVSNANNVTNLLIEGLRAIATLYERLVSSAYSALNVGATASANASDSFSVSTSTSENTNFNYELTTPP